MSDLTVEKTTQLCKAMEKDDCSNAAAAAEG